MKTLLPSKMSDLLELSLNDMEICLKDEKYELQSRHWHLPTVDGKCVICQAGAVLAQTFSINSDTDAGPLSLALQGLISDTDANRLGAIDSLR